jgi:phosphate regulon transcriptional regulator PhoB
MAGARILIVEDEADIVELLSYNLNRQGYEVESAATGPEGLAGARKGRPDLIVLDLMLPEMDGLEVCRVLKSESSTKDIPVIMLTAKSEEVDKVLGLELGADDYITKPFSPRELVARVKAVLRRAAAGPPTGEVIRVGEMEIDTATYTATIRGKPVPLSSTEFRLLAYLAQRRGRVFSRDQLLDAVWKDESYVEPRTVDVHIRRLREKIEDDPSHPAYVKTKRGVGYYMESGAP